MKTLFLISVWTSFDTASFHFLVTYCWSPERHQHFPLCCLPWERFRLPWGHHSAFSFPGWTSQVISAACPMSCPRELSASWYPSPEDSLVLGCPSYIVIHKTAYNHGEATAVKCWGQSPPLTGWQCCSWCTPGHGCQDTADSYSICHLLPQPSS